MSVTLGRAGCRCIKAGEMPFNFLLSCGALVPLARLAAFLSPIICAFLASVAISWKKKDKRMVVVFTAFAFQYVPWMFVERIVFIYHFFSSVPFIILCTVYVFEYFYGISKKTKYALYGYLGVVMLLFIVFYPVLSGIEVSKSYVEMLKWMKTWPF